MSILKLTLIFSAVQFLLVIATFLLFGLGLEGPRNLGHSFLWLLVQPGASLFASGPWMVIPLNSLLWGFCVAVFYKIYHR